MIWESQIHPNVPTSFSKSKIHCGFNYIRLCRKICVYFNKLFNAFFYFLETIRLYFFQPIHGRWYSERLLNIPDRIWDLDFLRKRHPWILFRNIMPFGKKHPNVNLMNSDIPTLLELINWHSPWLPNSRLNFKERSYPAVDKDYFLLNHHVNKSFPNAGDVLPHRKISRRVVKYLPRNSRAGLRLRYIKPRTPTWTIRQLEGPGHKTSANYTCNGHNLRYSSKGQALSARVPDGKNQCASAKRPSPPAPHMRSAYKAQLNRAQPPCNEIANRDRWMYTS